MTLTLCYALTTLALSQVDLTPLWLPMLWIVIALGATKPVVGR